ncbi:MAG: polysaccharide biosynthesis protein [Lachnospiraceae bacterium]
MEKKGNTSNFLVQGSILAIASIVSRIIGLVYRMPMTAIIGDLGNNYYGAAFEVYNLMLLISSYSIPLAVSKIVSAHAAKNEIKTVYRVVKCSLLFALSTGFIACLIVWFGAGFLTDTLLRTPLSIYALRVLAPTLVIFSVLGVLRGFFQGMGTMMPTAISQIIEQLVNAFISVLAAYFLFQYGTKVGGVLGNTREYSAAFGAAGGTFGTTMGAIAGLLFVIFVFAIFRPGFRKKMKREREKGVMDYGSILKVLVLTIVPVLLSTTIYNISSIVDQGIFKNIAAMQNYSQYNVDIWWGVFTGKYKVLINVPIAIASAMAASAVPSLTGAFTRRDLREVRVKTNKAIRFVMVIAFPCAVGMGVLASPILQLLFGDASMLAANQMRLGAVAIIFYSLSTLTNGILQGINRLQEPVKNAIIALILHILVLLILLFGFKLNIYAVVIATVVYPALMCILNGRSIRRYLHYRQEIRRTFIIPGICSAIMGVAVYFLYKGVMLLLSINSIATIAAIFVGAVLYGILLLLFRGLSASEIATFPKGRTLVQIFMKLHLLPRR